MNSREKIYKLRAGMYFQSVTGKYIMKCLTEPDWYGVYTALILYNSESVTSNPDLAPGKELRLGFIPDSWHYEVDEFLAMALEARILKERGST